MRHWIAALAIVAGTVPALAEGNPFLDVDVANEGIEQSYGRLQWAAICRADKEEHVRARITDEMFEFERARVEARWKSASDSYKDAAWKGTQQAIESSTAYLNRDFGRSMTRFEFKINCKWRGEAYAAQMAEAEAVPSDEIKSITGARP